MVFISPSLKHLPFIFHTPIIYLLEQPSVNQGQFHVCLNRFQNHADSLEDLTPNLAPLAETILEPSELLVDYFVDLSGCSQAKGASLVPCFRLDA